ncbi:hypothetical protein [Nocardiopsis salina]|uniref:hypothetical protein n=1 Tax=Nocardiopsis salina TaxID=245836 RepID=UPI0003491052|nr:hypothetical protein [Nocardiopsis salina]
MDTPEPTEVITGWIPHDARWHTPARTAAQNGLDPLRRYVTELVLHHRDGGAALTDEGDVRSIDAVVEDLGALGLTGVDWCRVRDSLLLPAGALGGRGQQD